MKLINKADYVFVSGLALHKNNCNPKELKDAHWDMNYHGYWLHRELNKRFLVTLALKGIEFAVIRPAIDYNPDW